MGSASLITNWKRQTGITNCRSWAPAQTTSAQNIICKRNSVKKSTRRQHAQHRDHNVQDRRRDAIRQEHAPRRVRTRVSAWIRKTKNDLVLNKDIYGHPPSIVFEKPASQYIKAKIIDPTTIPGYPPQGDNHTYMRQTEHHNSGDTSTSHHPTQMEQM